MTDLFKYTSAETALLILQNGKVRYSSPLLFNDPFDVQTELIFDFDINTFPQIVHEEIEDIIFSRKHVELNSNDEWGQALMLLREKVTTHGYYPEELKAVIELFLKYLTGLIDETRKQFNLNWQAFLPRLRVFSMSEINDNILMWSHYADYHEGVVFKFKVVPELDTPLSIAKPVIYKHTPPIFFTAKQWIEYILSNKDVDHQTLNWEYAYIKGATWSYEKEWRVWDLLPTLTEELFSDYELHPKEVEAIYFGCKINGEIRKKLIDAARVFNPKIKFYQAQKSTTVYGLQFVEI